MDDPKQKIPEDITKTKILIGSIELFDINILPERYRRKRFRLVNVLPWFLFIVMLAALYPSYTMAAESQLIFKNTQTEFARVQYTLEVYQANVNEFETLLAEIETAQLRREQIITSYQGLHLQGSSWSDTFSQIEKSSPDGIFWNMIALEENLIRLEGISERYSTILELQDTLIKFDGFKSVMIESIEQVVDEEVPVILSETGENSQPILPQSSSYAFTIIAITTGEDLP